MITKRTNVLLDDETKNILEVLKAKKKKSAGAVVRELLQEEGKRQGIGATKKRSRKEVLASIRRLRKYINTKSINYRELIEYGRKY